MDYDYFREYGIKQVYISDYLKDIHKNIFYDDYNLLKYQNKDISTLFVGIRNDNDINKINNHKNNIYLLLNESDVEFSVINSLLKKKDKKHKKSQKINDIEQIINIDKIKKVFFSFNCDKSIFENVNIEKKIEIIGTPEFNSHIMTIIISAKCYLYMNKIMLNNLTKIGWVVNFCDNNLEKISEIYKNYPNHFFIINCPFLIPDQFYNKKNYIIYQFEQYNADTLSIHYKEMAENGALEKCYENAFLALDYTKVNILKIKKILGYEPKYLPPPIKYNKIIYNKEKKYDIIFIGGIGTNKRRKAILNKIKEKYSLYIPPKYIFQDDLLDILKKSKILLNIHFFDNPILERLRLNECMTSGIRIISEKPYVDDMEICHKYKDVVDFIEIIDNETYDTTELEKCIDGILVELENNELCNKREKILENTIIKLENEFTEKLNEIFDVSNFIEK
jgi:hypothetical protein